MKEDVMNRLEKVLYTARAHTTGGHAGISRSSDGRLEVRLSRPGGPGTGTNPEQLFAAGWSACFESAMEFAARNMKITLPADHAVDAEIAARQSKQATRIKPSNVMEQRYRSCKTEKAGHLPPIVELAIVDLACHDGGDGRSDPGQTHQLKSPLLGGLTGRRRLVALSARSNMPTSIRSVFALRARRLTCMLAASTTRHSMPRALRNRASQKASYPAS
jgi:Ohr subfamily peroxiredoxin